MSRCYFMCLSVKDSSYTKDDKIIEAVSFSGIEYDPFEEMIIDVKTFNVRSDMLKDLPVKVELLPGRWMSLDIRPIASSQGGIFNTVEKVSVFNESNLTFDLPKKASEKK